MESELTTIAANTILVRFRFMQTDPAWLADTRSLGRLHNSRLISSAFWRLYIGVLLPGQVINTVFDCPLVHVWPSGPLYPPAATCCGQWCSRNKNITGTLGRKGCDHIGHRPYRPQPYRPQLDDIGHSKKPYRPHRKSISATTISAKTISATKISATKYVYLASSWRYVSVSRSPYGEFEREWSL